MSEKRISLADGFEDLLGTLRGLAGEYPGRSDMQSASGTKEAGGATYITAMVSAGEAVHQSVRGLTSRLEKIEVTMTQAVREQREVDEAAADQLQALLLELESLRGDPSTAANNVQDKPRGNESTEWQL